MHKPPSFDLNFNMGGARDKDLDFNVWKACVKLGLEPLTDVQNADRVSISSELKERVEILPWLFKGRLYWRQKSMDVWVWIGAQNGIRRPHPKSKNRASESRSENNGRCVLRHLRCGSQRVLIPKTNCQRFLRWKCLKTSHLLLLSDHYDKLTIRCLR